MHPNSDITTYSTKTSTIPKLTTALSFLGYRPESAKSKVNFDDFFNSLPHTRPLIQAIINTFSSPNKNPNEFVLTNEEAIRFEQLKCQYPPLLSDAQAISIADQVGASNHDGGDGGGGGGKAEEVREEEEDEEEEFIRVRLECVNRQTDMIVHLLQDAQAEGEHYDEEEDEDYDDDDDDDDDDGDYDLGDGDVEEEDPLDAVSSLREELTTLMYTTSPLPKQTEQVIANYVESEEQLLKSCRSVLSLATPEVESNEDEIHTMIDSYARLQALTVGQTANRLRIEHMAKSKGHESLSAKILRRDVDETLEDAKRIVMKQAYDTLYASILSSKASMVHWKLGSYSNVLHGVVTCLSKQRIRVIAVRLVQMRTSLLRRHLFDSLHIINSTCSPSPSPSPSCAWTARPISAMAPRNAHVHLTVDEEEEVVFRSLYETVRDRIGEFQQAVGCQRAWLDLDISDASKSLLGQWEEQLSSNAVVLDTLLRTRRHILQRHDQNYTSNTQSPSYLSSASTSSPTPSSSSSIITRP